MEGTSALSLFSLLNETSPVVPTCISVYIHAGRSIVYHIRKLDTATKAHGRILTHPTHYTHIHVRTHSRMHSLAYTHSHTHIHTHALTRSHTLTRTRPLFALIPSMHNEFRERRFACAMGMPRMHVYTQICIASVSFLTRDSNYTIIIYYITTMVSSCTYALAN